MESIPTKETIQSKITDRLKQIGIYNTTSNAFVDKFIEAQTIPYTELTPIIEAIQDNMFFSTAYGSALDKHGSDRNVSRLMGTYPYDTSHNNFKIYIANNQIAKNVTVDGLGIYIPAGTKIMGGPCTFMTVETVYLEPEQNEVYCGIVGTEILDTPIPASSLTYLDLTAEQISNANSIALAATPLKCTNTFPIQPGSYQEKDNDYKVRMVEQFKTYNPKMESAIRSAALGVPGVVDISFQSNTHGIGTKSLIVLTKEPFVSDGIIHAVSAAISFLADSSVIVMRPEYRSVSVTNSLTFGTVPGDTTNIKNKISSAQKDYINNLRSGQTLSYETLNSLSKATDANISSSIVTCLKIDNRLVSLTDQICGWDEKFVTVDTDSEAAIKFTK